MRVSGDCCCARTLVAMRAAAMADALTKFSVEENSPQNSKFIHTDIVLVGGGHTHVQVLKSFGMKPVPGVRVTLIAKELNAPYSGMLPGLVAGHYTFDECHIDLVRLARFADARLIHGSANRIDRSCKRIHIEGRPPLAYDVLSIDVGITPNLGGIDGANEHTIAVKPISAFWPKWQTLRQRILKPGGPRRISIIGGGAAGFELSLAADYGLRGEMSGHEIAAQDLTITLVAGDKLLPTHNARARQLARKALARRGICLIEGDQAVSVDENAVRLCSGRHVVSDTILVATGAAAPTWLAETDLPLDDNGYLALRATLQVLDDDDVFAAGDCATVLEHRREKSGVFAVRQGPPLIRNLRQRAKGQSAIDFSPQKYFLTLLSLADGSAIAAKGRFAFEGTWAWRWKDHIDRKFMDKFNELPEMAVETDDGGMRCGGCAAKVGPATLSRTLDRLHLSTNGARDDAAVIDNGGDEFSLETIDFFRAFWPDPYVLGRVAANHALNDVFAMGGVPDRALALAVLPFGKPKKVEEDLYQVLAGAQSVFSVEGVQLAGGHSSEGAELSIGFSVHGSIARKHLLGKAGLKPGDALILTKPIGTGVLFAAEMRCQAKAGAVAAALHQMQTSNRRAMEILLAHGATAATDITGFGLGGHLAEMLDASGVAARLNLGKVPTLPQVVELSKAGVASTLLPQNLSNAAHIEPLAALTPETAAVLFDPQTSGGILAGLPEEKYRACLECLHRAGVTNAIRIGSATDASAAGTITISGSFQPPIHLNDGVRDEQNLDTSCGDADGNRRTQHGAGGPTNVVLLGHPRSG